MGSCNRENIWLQKSECYITSYLMHADGKNDKQINNDLEEVYNKNFKSLPYRAYEIFNDVKGKMLQERTKKFARKTLWKVNKELV